MTYRENPYQTETLQLDLEGLSVALAVVTNTDELYDRLVAKGGDHEDVLDERIPYWADLWHAALALSRHLLRHKCIEPGMKVLEIGCGLGLTGIVAGKMGAELTFTDYMEEALDLAEENWQRNLDRPARFFRMDWRSPYPDVSADLILAADVVYERRAFEPLLHTFQQLCGDQTTILLSEPNRPLAKDFFKMLESHGFRYSSVEMQENWKGITCTINILTISKA